MEQAKKRDHKIMITDVAISKVPYVEVPGLSKEICKAIQIEHKEILRLAQRENESNEVLSLFPRSLSKPVRVKGGEFEVYPSDDPRAVSLFSRSGRQELMYLHNHPSTNSFSLADIMTFIQYGEIGLLTVVTNQGEVYILYKTAKYSYADTNRLFDKVYREYQSSVLDHNSAVKEFLKICCKGGIVYARD